LMFSPRIAKAALKIENWFAALPEGHRRTEVAKLLEVFFEQRPQTPLKFIGAQLH
jgi:hypothetical protein